MKPFKDESDRHIAVTIPGSKSVTHRALIAGALANGRTVLENPLHSEDTFHTARILEAIGVGMAREKDRLILEGGGENLGVRNPWETAFFLGNSGTSFRLLMPVLALARGRFLMTGTPRMLERPVGPLVDALGQLGVKIKCVYDNGRPPVQILSNGIFKGEVEISGKASSQFISALLLCAPLAQKDMQIKIEGTLVSKPYVDLTVDVMAAFGVMVERDGYSAFRVPAGQRYRPCTYRVSGDASSASYFWAAAAVTGACITTKNIHSESRQGDMRLLEILETMGCRVIRNTDQVLIQGGALRGIDVDMGAMPDMVPTLAAVALFADGKTAIRNVAQLRYKESDRLSAVTQEFRKLGAHVEEFEDHLIIHGGVTLNGATVDPHDDHRIAMSLAVAGLRVPGIHIQNRSCVNKSFPSFWELWKAVQSL